MGWGRGGRGNRGGVHLVTGADDLRKPLRRRGSFLRVRRVPEPIYPGVPAIDLGPEFDCGYLTVPQNREQPKGKKIRIAVARIKATSANPAPDPIVYLAGGPGGSGLLSPRSVSWMAVEPCL